MKSHKKISRAGFRLLLALLLGLATVSGVAGADKPAIRDIVVGNSTQDLLLYFQVDHAFRPEMEEGVLNGIPATFTFMVSLREVENGRPGRQLVELTFNRTLSYDVLKEEYRLHLSDRDTTLTCNDLARAKKLMASVSGTPVIGLGELQPGREYFLSAKVKLERKTLPLFFHYLIPFWEMGDYETDWHYVQFKY